MSAPVWVQLEIEVKGKTSRTLLKLEEEIIAVKEDECENEKQHGDPNAFDILMSVKRHYVWTPPKMEGSKGTVNGQHQNLEDFAKCLVELSQGITQEHRNLLAKEDEYKRTIAALQEEKRVLTITVERLTEKNEQKCSTSETDQERKCLRTAELEEELEVCKFHLQNGTRQIQQLQLKEKELQERVKELETNLEKKHNEVRELETTKLQRAEECEEEQQKTRTELACNRQELEDTKTRSKFKMKLHQSNSTVEQNALAVDSFLKECFTLCWLMCVQDPPVVFGPFPRRGDRFETDAYKAYTSSGPFVDFVVWPALYLHEDGPVLCKGIAQGLKRNGFDGRRTQDNEVHTSEQVSEQNMLPEVEVGEFKVVGGNASTKANDQSTAVTAADVQRFFQLMGRYNNDKSKIISELGENKYRACYDHITSNFGTTGLPPI
ncbi:hypothetical protein MAR_009860 [Mya arenaria]|uniref:Mitochondria-eating protein C-terminal domain-containing protein n=1 Tax=Mya arenaria TaxID=6604 RepID=A0ABY7E2Y3_MYAAR|nr:hypothetical protein MAR_009860 [Mya arenaria]